MHNYIEDDEHDDVQYIVKKRRKPTKKIIYEDYVDRGESDENNENDEKQNEEKETVEEVVQKKQ